MASASCSFFLADILLGRDSNHTVSNSKPAELLQQTTRGFQAAGIVREYPDRGNSPHALSIREVLFHETGCHISVVKFTDKSARVLLCASTLKIGWGGGGGGSGCGRLEEQRVVESK